MSHKLLWPIAFILEVKIDGKILWKVWINWCFVFSQQRDNNAGDADNSSLKIEEEIQKEKKNNKRAPNEFSVDILYSACLAELDNRGFMLMILYLFQDLIFPSCITVDPTWTRSSTGCLRQDQERTQYPAVYCEEICRELFYTIWITHSLARFPIWCQSSSRTFLTGSHLTLS